ncbi:MAG: hypothetical protein ACN4GR_04920 [Arenicellales bacterium]
MFGNRNKETTTVSEYFEKKSKLIQKKNKIFKSRINHAIRGEHRHYFSKNDVAAQNMNARCKVCGMLLSEFRVQRRFETWTPDLKPVRDATTTPGE